MSSSESVEIQPIDKNSINQICSAQVVLNLATAVKELVENSIDAGATNIQIKLLEYGSEIIEVIDNGCGVEESNFQALTLKHCTSKITKFPDLYNVKTFGFRGEALSSLCSLCNVTIITQHKNSDIGATLKFDHQGVIINHSKTKRQIGTTVILKNLFSTLPIRRAEFLRNLKKEFAKMCNVLYAYGLKSSGVRIMCTNNFSKTKTCKETHCETSKKFANNVIMNVKGDSIESNIMSIFGVKQKQSLLKFIQVCPTQETLRNFGLENINLDIKKFQLSGFISSCSHGCGRASSDRQFYYINSRPMDHSKISKLINEIYHQYNKHQDPFVLLDIKAACGSFDLNLTPDKRQIFLQDEKFLLAIIKESLHTLFKKITCTLEIQNLEVLKNVTAQKEIVSADNKFKKFLSKIKNTSKNQETISIESTIKNSSAFPLPTKLSSSHSSTNKVPLEPVVTIEDLGKESKKKIMLSLHSPHGEKSLLESSNKLNFSSPLTTNSLEFSTQESFEEPNIQIRALSNASEYKRKENPNLFVDNSKFIEQEEHKGTEIKRLKLDGGLGKNDKSNRREISLFITFSDVRRLHKNNQQKWEENFDDSKIKFLANITAQNNELAESELKKKIHKESFQKMEIIGQFNLGFIITKLDSDLFIIDQHASDEKFNFETLQATVVLEVQKLFTPEKLELTIEKEELILQHRDIFRKNGFEFFFDEKEAPTKRVSLIAKPHSKNIIFGKDDVDELLFQLEKVPEIKNLRPSRVDNILASRACRKSVMIGTALNNQEMKKIVTHMGKIEQPWNCPHGRPTMRHLINLTMLHLEI